MGKSKKNRTTGKKKVKDLAVKDAAKTVAGGRTAGTQEKYLEYKLTDVFVSSV